MKCLRFSPLGLAMDIVLITVLMAVGWYLFAAFWAGGTVESILLRLIAHREIGGSRQWVA
ncbi:hypothetical protein [Rhodomicrobium lacus]|uniref:hypothetical protein n=1 Tax=Rhodomicrobium lacus TaxID=2498452 RepID=UPI000F8E8804|nr:hypothetical protein [Rhodomicrobium lacus]